MRGERRALSYWDCEERQVIAEIAGELARAERKSRRTGKPARCFKSSCTRHAAAGPADAGSWAKRSLPKARLIPVSSSPR